MHWYRKILKTYDPETKKVLLSKKGSRRLIENLQTPDKDYTLDDLERDNSINGCNVRPADHKLF